MAKDVSLRQLRYFVAAAETGQLDHIPAGSFTPDLLLHRNDHGDTPLHAAAYEGHLDQIPEALFTPELLQARNYNGVSVLRTAVVRGYTAELPAALRPKPQSALRRTLEQWGVLRRQY